MSAGEAARENGSVRAWLVWWVLCAATWMALVDRLELAELVTGAVTAALGATLAILVRRQRPLLLRPRRAWLWQIPRALLGLVTDLPLLVRVVWRRGILRRPERGALVEVPLESAGPGDAAVAADRVAAQILRSIAPAVVAVEADADRGVLIEHRLEAP
jgi:multisubunit Na+/H+ antiporter MnhE subunit